MPSTNHDFAKALVAIGGGSCSGKTACCHELGRRLGPTVQIVCADNYYQPLDHLPPPERKRVNFDQPGIMRYPLLIEHLRMLKEGRVVKHPKYDFTLYTPGQEIETLEPKPIIIVPGHLILCHEELRGLFDYILFLDVDEETRRKRREERDQRERGRTPELIDWQWRTFAQPGFLAYIEPAKQHADRVIQNWMDEGFLTSIVAHLQALAEN